MRLRARRSGLVPGRSPRRIPNSSESTPFGFKHISGVDGSHAALMPPYRGPVCLARIVLDSTGLKLENVVALLAKVLCGSAM